MEPQTVKKLSAGDRLSGGAILASPSKRAQLAVDEGSIAIRATPGVVQAGPGPGRVAYVLMQKDGNLVAFDQERRHVWASGTAGERGAVAVMSDAGDLVVQSATGELLWTSAMDFEWRTVKTTDSRGYRYDETSPAWEKACEALPCFAALAWPGYRTAIVERKINGEEVVIQLWKGRCQRFLGLDDFPGGIGAEVGVYRRKDLRIPRRLHLGNALLDAWLRADLRLRANDDFWWAAPEFKTKLAFEFINPITHEVIFSAADENSYWLNKWLYPEDYGRYGDTVGNSNMPQSSSHCLLRYSINDEPMQYWPGDDPSLAYDPALAELVAA